MKSQAGVRLGDLRWTARQRARCAELARTHGRALNRGIRFAIYTEPLFKTTNDADNRAALAAAAAEALDFVGIGVHGPRKTVDKVVNGLKFLG